MSVVIDLTEDSPPPPQRILTRKKRSFLCTDLTNESQTTTAASGRRKSERCKRGKFVSERKAANCENEKNDSPSSIKNRLRRLSVFRDNQVWSNPEKEDDSPFSVGACDKGQEIEMSSSKSVRNSPSNMMQNWGVDVWEPLTPLLARYEHAASDEALKALLTTSCPGSRIWEENTNSLTSDIVTEYDHPTSFLSIPPELGEWTVVYSCDTRTHSRKQDALSPLLRCCLMGDTDPMKEKAQMLEDTQRWSDVPTIRLSQILLNPVAIPASGSDWCRVNSLEELNSLAEKAIDYQRMLMIVCSHQGPTLWEPMFASWALSYPRIVFASIDTDIANSGSRHLRKKLLGYSDQIHGLSFMSHIGNPSAECEYKGLLNDTKGQEFGTPRYFIANNVDTAGIEASLLMRFRTDLQLGLLPQVEEDSIASEASLSPGNAYRRCISQLLTIPLGLKFCKRIREVSYGTAGERSGDDSDIGGIIGTVFQPYLLQNNLNQNMYPTPSEMILPLRPEQQRSLHWMMQREHFIGEKNAGSHEDDMVEGVVIHTAKLNVPPLTRVRVDWMLHLTYRLRGGVLADAMGFGKTAIVLALVACTRDKALKYKWSFGEGAQLQSYVELENKQRSVILAVDKSYSMYVSQATLVIVPSHLLKQWEEEFVKFFGTQEKIKLIAIYTSDDIPDVQSLQNCDVVLVSQRLFMSSGYKKMLGMDIGESDSLLMDSNYLCRLNDLRKDPSGNIISGKGRSKRKVCLLEKIRWFRVVYDEIHELASSLDRNMGTTLNDIVPQQDHGNENAWSLPLRCLESETKWGLTGTPLIQRCADIHSLGGVLGLHLGSQDADICRRFVDKYFRSSTLTEVQWPEPRERIISFTLSVEEKVLYLQRSYEYAGDIAKNDSTALRELLLTCSHHSLRGMAPSINGAKSSSRNAVRMNASSQESAEDEVTRVQRKKEERLQNISQKAAVIREKLQVLDNAVSRAACIPEASSHEEALIAERKRRAALGRRDECADQLREMNHEIDSLKKFLDFFRSSLQSLRSRETLPECPICLDKLQWGTATITPCGHFQCVTCAMDLINKHGKCATCRVELEANQWRVVQKSDMTLRERQLSVQRESSGQSMAHVEGVEYTPSSDMLRLYGGHGSKISHIIAHLKHIESTDPLAKVLLYCQWDALKVKLLNALRDADLGCISLDGNPKQIASAVELFSLKNSTRRKNNKFILVCSLEHKAAGLNLQSANHVMFVHPFFSPILDRVSSWEAQAVGRVLRPGQERLVTIWRFIALETIEQELLVRNNTSTWRDHYDPQTLKNVDFSNTS